MSPRRNDVSSATQWAGQPREGLRCMSPPGAGLAGDAVYVVCRRTVCITVRLPARRSAHLLVLSWRQPGSCLVHILPMVVRSMTGFSILPTCYIVSYRLYSLTSSLRIKLLCPDALCTSEDISQLTYQTDSTLRCAARCGAGGGGTSLLSDYQL